MADVIWTEIFQIKVTFITNNKLTKKINLYF